MRKYIIYFIVSFSFLGCSGGGGTSTDSPYLPQTVTSTLIDSVVSGVSYSCGEYSGLTDLNGQFSCKENDVVYFSIGGINLGATIITLNDQYIIPALLYNLSSSNITDTRLINFIQLVQSLDSDSNVSNGIDINQTTRDGFIGYSLDLSNVNITESDINDTVNVVGSTLVSQEQALAHYIDTLTNTLNIILQNEPYYGQQWYLDYNSTMYTQNNINDNAHINVGSLLRDYNGKGVKIAVIDDGLDVTHEDLDGAIVNTYDIATKSTNVAHTNVSDFHGTAVTGIIGARVNAKGVHGVASGAEIIFIKYKEIMSDSETIELFNKAQEFGADIINCSWGTYDVSDAVKDKIVDLANNGRDGKGTIIVFATGNDDQDMGNDESAIPEVIAVGTTDKDNLRAWYSNFGQNLDVVAPGGYDLGITTLDPMESNGIASIDDNYLLFNDSNSFIGTSASAPIVSGVIALILEKNPNLTRIEIENILENTSDKIGNVPYENSRNDYYGYGKINLINIIDSI